MSIASKLSDLADYKTDIANKITEKGGTLSQNAGYGTFATDIATIPTGVSEQETVAKFLNWGFTELTADYFVGVSKIPVNMFFRNTNLKKVVLSNDVEQVLDSAFAQSGVTEILMPKVTHMGAQIFAYGSMYNITFPDTLIQMGNAVFSGKTGITATFLGTNPPTITNNTFPVNDSSTVIFVPHGYKQTYVNKSANWAGYSSNIVELQNQGTLGTGGDYTTLPTSGYLKGYSYTAITSATYNTFYGSVDCRVGDLMVARNDSTGSNTDWVCVRIP